MIRRPPRSTLRPSSAASDVYKRQHTHTHTHTQSAKQTHNARLTGQRRSAVKTPTANKVSLCVSGTFVTCLPGMFKFIGANLRRPQFEDLTVNDSALFVRQTSVYRPLNCLRGGSGEDRDPESSSAPANINTNFLLQSLCVCVLSLIHISEPTRPP